MFKMFMGPKPSLAITHPDLARQVLTRHQERDVSICFCSSQRPKKGSISAHRGNSDCALFSCQDFRKADNDAIASKSIQAPLNYTKDSIQALHEKQCLFRRSSAVCFFSGASAVLVRKIHVKSSRVIPDLSPEIHVGRSDTSTCPVGLPGWSECIHCDDEWCGVASTA